MGTLPRLTLSPQPSLPMQAQSESKLKLKLELRPWTSSTTLAAGLSEPLTILPTGPKTLTKMLHPGQPLLSTTLEVPLRMLPTGLLALSLMLTTEQAMATTGKPLARLPSEPLLLDSAVTGKAVGISSPTATCTTATLTIRSTNRRNSRKSTKRL